MRGIVLKIGDKGNGVTYKEQTRKKLLQCFLLTKTIKRRLVSILLKSQGIKKVSHFVTHPKQKGIKKGCFYERSIPNFRDNKKITIKYYSVI